MRFRAPLPAALTMATVLTACGGGGPTTPDVTPPAPPPPVTTVVSQGSQSGLGEKILLMVPFRTASAGSIRASVDWTFPASTIYVYISSGRCTIAEVNAQSCPFVAVSETSAPKPRVVTVNSAAAGDYMLYIGNFAGEEESVSWQVQLTASASSAAAATATAAPARPSVQWRP